MTDSIVSDYGAKGWYPQNINLLRQVIDEHIDAWGWLANVTCVIAPHAGLRWCAETFSKTMSYVRDDYDLVVLIGPSHRVRFQDKILLTNKSRLITPLGDCELFDSEHLYDIGVVDNHQHTLEHSIHMHIPYIQRFIPDCSVLPIIVSRLTDNYINIVVDRLRSITTDRTLLMISSDFTHYGDKFNYTPYSSDIKEQITNEDKKVIDMITSLDYNRYTAHMNNNDSTICGKEAIRIAMKYIDKQSHGELVSYTMSGDHNNDYNNSVSYAGIIFHDK